MSRDFFQSVTRPPVELTSREECERAYWDLLATYNRIVDYIDSPEMASDLQRLIEERVGDIHLANMVARSTSEHLRHKLHDQPTPEGWQPLPDDGHDAPPELTNGPLWLATTRGDIRPGYYQQSDGNPTVWSSEPTEGVFKWWRPIDAEPPSLGAQPPLPEYAACKQPTRDTSTAIGIVTHVRDRWVDVHLDCDDDDETVGCRNECGEDLATGDTVVTQFVPPHTVYVVSKLKGGG